MYTTQSSATFTATLTATTTDPPNTNTPTMHSRLVSQDRIVCLLEPAFLQQQQKNLKKKNLSFAILA